jgi:hypothetical protein
MVVDVGDRSMIWLSAMLMKKLLVAGYQLLAKCDFFTSN